MIYITRHGFRQDRDGVWRDTAERLWDPPLNFERLRACIELSGSIEGVDAVYSSPFLRAVQTAHCIACMLDVPVRVEQALGEKPRAAKRDAGDNFSLLSLTELKRHYYTVDTSYVSLTEYNVNADRRESGRRIHNVILRVIDNLTAPAVFVAHGWSTKWLVGQLIKPKKHKIVTHCPGLIKLSKDDDGWNVVQ